MSSRAKAEQVTPDSTPVYGTADGEPVDQSIPVYGTPESSSPERARRPRLTRRGSFADRSRRVLGRLARLLRRGHGSAGLDWSTYPGIVAGDSRAVLDGIRLDEVLERNDRVLSRIRRALEAEFRVHWWANTDREALEEVSNSFSGASLLHTARSAVWRTTSGLTSIEDRDMAARIAGVALTHEGFVAQHIDRSDDEWTLTARSAERPESVVILQLGFSEFELVVDSSAVLASENEAEFRLRAAPFLMHDA